MSLYDKMRCEACGHARHEHTKRDTKAGRVEAYCSRCECERWVEPAKDRR